MISKREALLRADRLALAAPWRRFEIDKLDPGPGYRCCCKSPQNGQYPACTQFKCQHALAVLAGEAGTAPDLSTTMFHTTRASRWLHPWTETAVARSWLTRGMWGSWAFSEAAWLSPLGWPEALRGMWGLHAPTPWELANCYVVKHAWAPYLIGWCSGLSWDILISLTGSASAVVTKMREEIAYLLTKPRFLLWLYKPQLRLLPDYLRRGKGLAWKTLLKTDWWRMICKGAFPRTLRERPLHWRLVRNGWWLGLT